MKGNNFYHSNISGRSISPQDVAATTVNGVTIEEPWRKCEILAFFLMVGGIAGTSITFSWEVRLRGTSTWKDLMDSAGTPADVTVAVLAAAANTLQVAEIRTADLDCDTYDAIRVQATGLGAGVNLAAVNHVLAQLRERPGGDVNALAGVTMPFTYEA